MPPVWMIVVVLFCAAVALPLLIALQKKVSRQEYKKVVGVPHVLMGHFHPFDKHTPESLFHIIKKQNAHAYFVPQFHSCFLKEDLEILVAQKALVCRVEEKNGVTQYFYALYMV